MNFSRGRFLVLAAIPLLALGLGCSSRDPSGLPVARAPIDPLVFDDAFGDDVYPQAFSGTYLSAVAEDSIFVQSGTRSLKVTVPGRDSALGGYAGGVLTAVGVRDFADFNALTFYARSSVNSFLNEAGFGNDNTGNSLFSAGRAHIALSTEWTFVVIPIPSPSRLIAERGLFTYAEGWEAQHQAGHELWFDEIRYAKLGNIGDPRPAMQTVTKQYFVGATASLDGTTTTFDVDGADVVVNHMPGYFEFRSSDPRVARIKSGAVEVVGVGDAVVTATLDGIDAAGAVTLTGYVPPPGPAPAPTLPAQNVISMFSDVYQDVPVETWNPHWIYSTTEDAIYEIGGDETRMYSTFNFVGIVFKSQTIDASAMTHLHMDVFAPEGSDFKIEVFLYSGDNAPAIGDAGLTFDATSTPAFVAGEWSSLDIPLDDFQLAVPWDHVGQLVLSSTDASLILIDNVYWHD